MKETILFKENFQLMGISERTSNAEEMKGNGKIPMLWQRFYSEGIIEKLSPFAISSEIIVAYTDFESDDSGIYTIIIGQSVKSDANQLDGFELKSIPKSDYLQIDTEQGNIQTIGINAWSKIWESQPLRERRSFKADLEIYGKEAQNPDKAKFSIFLGLKSKSSK
jgi:predicted transcriptional regulator YdeE